MGLDPSLSELFWLNAYENGMSDAGRYFKRLDSTAVHTVEGLVKMSYRSVTDPFGLAYDQYQSIANLGSYLGKLSAEPCERQRALDALKKYAVTPEASADAVFFIESLLAGGAFAPEAGAAELGAGAESAAVRVAEEATIAVEKSGNAIEQALARAKRVGNQLEATLDDGTKVIFQRHIGSEAHPLPGYPKPTDHWGIKVHEPVPGRPGRFKQIENTHIIVDPSGKPIDIIR